MRKNKGLHYATFRKSYDTVSFIFLKILRRPSPCYVLRNDIEALGVNKSVCF